MTARPLYKMGTLARLTGLSPVLLRAWERRHALLQPERTVGGHRLYTEDDLRVLRRVKELLAAGRSIGEAAALGRDSLLRGAPTEPEPSAPPAPDRVLGRWRDELAHAGMTLDAARAERALDEAFASLTPDRALADVVEPGMRTIGDLWAQGRCTVAGEHLASGVVAGRLHRLFDTAAALAAVGPRAICACVPDELHMLGALSVAYWLARRGHRVTWLGPALPIVDLDRACEHLAPEGVYLSATTAEKLSAATPKLLDLVRRRRGVRFHLGGLAAAEADPALARAGVVVARTASFAELRAETFALPRPARGRRGP